MGDFFSFLLALLTFDWLRQRKPDPVTTSGRGLVEMSITGDCAQCEDGVWFDTRAVVWKHVSTGSVWRTTPPGAANYPFVAASEPHRAAKWLGWDRVEGEE